MRVVEIKDPTNALASVDVMGAKLPLNYIQARIALQRCESVDECKSWGDKAAALASYYKQSGDKTLEQKAKRIRARAVRRCGELLLKLSADVRGKKGRKGSAPSERAQAGYDAGMKPREVVQSVKVASLLEESFDRLVESQNPPSVSRLAYLADPNASRLPISLQVDIDDELKNRLDAGFHIAKRRHDASPNFFPEGSSFAEYLRQALREGDRRLRLGIDHHGHQKMKGVG